MNTVRVSISVSGTDDNGNARSFVGAGSIACSQALAGDILATASQVKINDSNAGDAYPSFIYLENYGAVDVAIGTTETNGQSRSVVVPPDAAIFISTAPLESLSAPALDVRVWTDTGTAQVHYILFS